MVRAVPVSGFSWFEIQKRNELLCPQVLMQQQEMALEEAIAKAQKDAMSVDAAECHINFSEFDTVLQPIIDSCTKDSISSGKAWILQRSTNSKSNILIASYLLYKWVLEAGLSLFRPPQGWIHD